MKFVKPEGGIKDPHAYAARSIRFGRKFPQSKKTLNAYINDAIDFHMIPEVGLYYSENCYGVADAIDFTNNFLRIRGEQYCELNDSEVTIKSSFLEAMTYAEKDYKLMIANGMRPEQARCVLPLCLKTEIVVTANYREWRNIFKLRTPVAAHPQMRELMCPLLKELQSKIPVVFDDIYTYWPKDDQTRKGSGVKE